MLTDLVQHEDKPLALMLPSPHFLLDESTSASLWVASIKDEDDDIALINDFV